jgi:uncharacterized phage protein gp47/JayE
MAGLTLTGFVTKSYEEISGEIASEIRSKIGTGVNTSTSSPLGQVIGIVSEKLAELWEVGLALYGSQDPNEATDRALDFVAGITGTRRLAATKSRVVATVNVDPGTYAAGTLTAHVAGNPQSRFTNISAVTNGGAVAASYLVEFEATATGPTFANAGTLTQIATPVSGWNSVTNAQDAVPGTNIENDASLRLRREDELAAAGGSTFDAIRSDLLQLLTAQGVIGGVTIFENDGDTTDENGLPPHSFEALVFDGTPTGTAVEDADIARAIWFTKPAGIKTHGSVTEAHVDSTGQTRSVRFSRPTTKNVYLAFDVVVDEELGWDPSSGPAAIKAAVVARGERVRNVGADVVLAQLYPAVLSVPGVVDISEVRAGFSPSPIGTVNLAIGLRELADYDTSRITVNVS